VGPRCGPYAAFRPARPRSCDCRRHWRYVSSAFRIQHAEGHLAPVHSGQTTSGLTHGRADGCNSASQVVRRYTHRQLQPDDKSFLSRLSNMCRSTSPLLGDQACNSRLGVRPRLLSSTPWPHKLTGQLQQHSAQYISQRHQDDQRLNAASNRAVQRFNVGYQLANSAAAVVATVALLISPVELSASKRSAGEHVT
jgi:hypothetical protein